MSNKDRNKAYVANDDGAVVLHDELDHLQVAMACCAMHGCMTAVVQSIDVCSMVYESTGCVQVAILGCPV